MFLRIILSAFLCLLASHAAIAGERCIVAKQKSITVMLLAPGKEDKGELTQEFVEINTTGEVLPAPRSAHIRDQKNPENYTWRIPTTCMSAMKAALTKEDIARVVAVTKN